MVIASQQKGERRAVMLGMTAQDVAQLRIGKAIRVNPDSDPACPEAVEILISYGETDAAVVDQMTREASSVGVPVITLTQAGPRRPQ